MIKHGWVVIFVTVTSHRGLGESEPNYLPWRLTADTSFIAVEKKPVLLCSYICKLARDGGFGEVLLQDHALKPMMRPPAPQLDAKRINFVSLCFSFLLRSFLAAGDA